jgi:hypothetical protein
MRLLLLLLICTVALGQTNAPKRLPPSGIAVPPGTRAALTDFLRKFQAELAAFTKKPLSDAVIPN